MYISILEQALLKMPNYFTSNMFRNQAIKLGASPDFLKRHQPTFLKTNCLIGETRRTWYKASANINIVREVKKQQSKKGLFRRFINWIY